MRCRKLSAAEPIETGNHGGDRNRQHQSWTGNAGCTANANKNARANDRAQAHHGRAENADLPTQFLWHLRLRYFG
jgi:hypothetical protein